MLSFSKTGPISELKEAVASLTAEDAFDIEAKAMAISMIDGVKGPAASVNLKVNRVDALDSHQVEIQVAGRPGK